VAAPVTSTLPVSPLGEGETAGEIDTLVARITLHARTDGKADVAAKKSGVAPKYASACTVARDRVPVFPEAFPRTRARLERAGIRTRVIAADELAKAEGALTCCSLILNM